MLIFVFELNGTRGSPGESALSFDIAKGMVIVGSFVGQEEEDLYVWIRRFESEEECKRQYEAVDESDHWKNVSAPKSP